MEEIYFFKPERYTKKEINIGNNILIYSSNSQGWQWAVKTVARVIRIKDEDIEFELHNLIPGVSVQNSIMRPAESRKFIVKSNNIYDLPKSFIVDVE